MWLDYWKVAHDPFLALGSPFVPTVVHAEAVARLVHTIESADRLAEVRGQGGLGKSRVLGQALKESRSPLRRLGSVGCESDRWAGDAPRTGGRPESAFPPRAAVPMPGESSSMPSASAAVSVFTSFWLWTVARLSSNPMTGLISSVCSTLILIPRRG